MAQGLSLHIGLNRVDPTKYQDENGKPWDGALGGCIADANAMLALAQTQGFTPQQLLDDQATSENVSNAISHAAQNLESGDIFLVTYSGHGGQVPDMNGEEDDQYDETWCLYDRELVDDELFALWSKFRKGVRVFVLSDSCHSGSVIKDPNFNKVVAATGLRFRLLPPSVQRGTYQKSKDMYDSLQTANPSGDRVEVVASVVLISGCQDNQLSADGDENGLFTGTLLQVWNNGKYRGDVPRFWRRIVSAMPLYQSPNLFRVGTPNPQFEKQRPFTI